MGGRGEAPGHEGDHGPQDHGFVAGGQVLIIAGGAAVFADPGEGPFDDPVAGQDLEGVRVALGHDLEGHLQCGGPGGQRAGVSGIGPDQADTPAGAVGVPQQRPAATRSWTDAAVTTTSKIRPVVSTAMCRLRPLTFLALSQPRVALGTVSAARTDWESITAAVGWGVRPAAVRTWARSTSCSRAKVPSSRQAAK